MLFPDAPILGQVALSYCPIIDRHRNVMATRLTVFPLGQARWLPVGELLRRAAIRLRSEWAEGEDQVVEEHFKQPDFVSAFDLETFKGDAYPTYSWAVNAIEVEVDTYTGQS